MKVRGVSYLDHRTGGGVELPQFDYIAFGEGRDEIHIEVRDGRVRVRACEGRIIVEPNASNVVVVEAVDFFGGKR